MNYRGVISLDYQSRVDKEVGITVPKPQRTDILDDDDVHCGDDDPGQQVEQNWAPQTSSSREV